MSLERFLTEPVWVAVEGFGMTNEDAFLLISVISVISVAIQEVDAWIG